MRGSGALTSGNGTKRKCHPRLATSAFGVNGHSKCYGGFKPQPSLLVLRHPFAGHALGRSIAGAAIKARIVID
jgi:hypothetical protein